MARTEHLPIYKATYDLCLHFDRVVRGFPRYHKYSLGADLREAARRSLRLVVRANSRREKAPVLLELREELEALPGSCDARRRGMPRSCRTRPSVDARGSADAAWACGRGRRRFTVVARPR